MSNVTQGFSLIQICEIFLEFFDKADKTVKNTESLNHLKTYDNLLRNSQANVAFVARSATPQQQSLRNYYIENVTLFCNISVAFSDCVLQHFIQQTFHFAETILCQKSSGLNQFKPVHNNYFLQRVLFELSVVSDLNAVSLLESLHLNVAELNPVFPSLVVPLCPLCSSIPLCQSPALSFVVHFCKYKCLFGVHFE